MKGKAVSGIMLTLILASMLTLAFNIQPVKASGTVYIRSDGSVEGTAKIQRDGDVYTFTANINNGIVVEIDNIVVDGAGYTLSGTHPCIHGSVIGIDLSGRNNVTIKNVEIKYFEEGGIKLYWSSNITISENNITQNYDYGIRFYWSSKDTISGNIIASNYCGLLLEYSSYNSVSGNNITNNYWGTFLDESSNSIIYHNTFVDNTEQVGSHDSMNVWDDGYPSGGNCWSDYEERYPEAEELDNSGIWDTPYVIDENNQDSYPLIETWSPKPPSPIEALEELTETVESWNFDTGIERSLTSKLHAAHRSLEKETQNAAMGQLTAFTNQVKALEGKKLTNEQADYLIAEAQSIINLIEG